MKKIIKTTLLILTILLLTSCGEKKDENIVANAEEIKEVVSSRSIIVSEVNGTASVTHGNEEKTAVYEGMRLLDGDDVIVDEKSNLTLSIDSDKHLFADENSHFWLSATGSEGNTKTVIHLNEGSVLCDIKEKLKDEETFDIQTASSTMCVRGTVFRVCLMKGKDNSTFDLVEVYDGKVWSNIENSEDNLTLEPGQCALIRKTDSTEETVASFVLADDINDKFIEETGLNISLDQAENAELGALKISLDNVPADTLNRLVEIIDEGTPLAVEKEEIKKVEKVKIEEKEKEHTHNFVVQSRTESSCSKQGNVVYKCSICNETKTEYLPLKDHTPIRVYGHSASCTENGLTDGAKCSVCGKAIEEQKTISALGHNDVLDADGVTHKCSRCGSVLSVDKPKEDEEVKYEQYKINSFGKNSFATAVNNVRYSTYCDNVEQIIVFDFTISDVTLKAHAIGNVSNITTVYPASIIARYSIPISETSKSNPNCGVPKFYYKDEEILLDDGLDTTYNNSIIHQNMCYFLGKQFVNSTIPLIPEDFSTISDISIDSLGNNIYSVKFTLPATSSYSDFNITGGSLSSGFTIYFTIEIEMEKTKDGWEVDGAWDVYTYLFGIKSNKTSFSEFTNLLPESTSETFSDKVKAYATNHLPK